MPFDNTVPENGLVHYGAGLPISLCGVRGPKRETNTPVLVTCPGCKSQMKRTGR